MKSEKELELPDELAEKVNAEAEEPEASEPMSVEEEKARKALEILKSLDEEEEHVKVSVRTILGGDILTSGWLRKQFWFIGLLTFFAIIYISNRYAYQQEMIETKKLSDTLLDRRFKSLTRSSQLLEKTLRSRVEEDLLDSTLQTAKSPSYVLKTEDE